MGLKQIKCVDINGTIINNLKVWRLKNPRKLYFESQFELDAYRLLKASGLNFEFHPESRELLPKKQVWALSKSKIKKLFKSTTRTISYTPDFAVHCDDGKTIFIETKGFFHKDSRMRYKLFQHSLSKTEMSLLVFDTYNKKGQDRMTDLKVIIKIIKNEFNKKNSTNKINI